MGYKTGSGLNDRTVTASTSTSVAMERPEAIGETTTHRLAYYPILGTTKPTAVSTN